MPDLVTVGITTAPREVDYLPGTLETLLPQTSAVHVFAEPGVPVRDGVAWHQNTSRLGNYHNWLSMAHWLLVHTATPYLLTAEDDVVFAATAIDKAVTAARRKRAFGFISLYVSGKFYQPGMNGVLHIQPRRLWGACAWLFSRDVLARIVSHRYIASWRGDPHKPPRVPSHVDGVDLLVGRILVDLQLPMYFMHPAVVQHIGRCSSVGNNEGLTKGRTAPEFIDKDVEDDPTHREDPQ